MKGRIYCLSGLGAGEKVFDHLKLTDYELTHIPWTRPAKNEDIGDYARRIAAVIQDPSPILLGVSFGGIIGIEIARLLPVKKLFIISSIKSKHELPQWMQVAGALYLDKMLPPRSYKLAGKIGDYRLGAITEEEKEMVRDYRRKSDPLYVEWAIRQVLSWKNSWRPEGIIQIHGDKDKIFPLRKISADYIIKDGTHFMIYNRGAEISRIINAELHAE